MSLDVTFIVPVYNDTRHLRACLDSVAAQRSVRAGVVLVDDGSESANVRSAFGDHPAVVRAERIPHGGVSAARNSGLSMAEAPVVGLLDADDLLEPNFAFRLLEALHEKQADLAYCDYDRFSESAPGERLIRYEIDQGAPADTPVERIVQSNLQTGTFLVRAEVARAAGPFDQSIRHCEDWEWLMRVAEVSSAWVHVPERLFHYRDTEGSASRNFEEMYLQSGKILRAMLDRHRSERLERLSERYWLNRKRTAASRVRRYLLESVRNREATRALRRIASFVWRHPELVPFLFRRFPKP
ncbi:MAG: glycosyltransferase [Fimbriimonadales bacterium]